MILNELWVGSRVLISTRPSEKEVAVILGFTPQGTVIIRDSYGKIVDIPSAQIIKKF